MRKRRTKRKFTWFPVIGSAGPVEDEDDFNQLMGQFNVLPNGSSLVFINPLIPDVPMEGDEIDPSAPGQLVQALGQEYYIERIVGKIFLGVSGSADDSPTTVFPKTVLVGAGLFVARANDADVGGGANTPIGSASLAERQENYSPLGVDAIREPWMWRRTWILNTGRPNPNTNAATGFGPTFQSIGGTITFAPGAPKTNMQYGSVLDGPHMDVKSVRRVGNDERLFLVVATRALDVEFASGGVTPNAALDTVNGDGVVMAFDYRVLGRLTRSRGKSSF